VTSEFSVLLRQLRQQTGLTQEDLAARSGLAVRTIRRLETGENVNPRLETVRLLADALGLQPDERARMLAVADGQASPESSGVNGSQPESAFTARLAEATDDLAHAVGARWGREEELRRIQDPFPLPVGWQLAPDDVMDHWENICRVSPGESAKPLDLAGHLPEITDIYRRIPSGRLVVLGRAGSGKSVLAVRFVLDLLKRRPRAGAVPVLIAGIFYACTPDKMGAGLGTKPKADFVFATGASANTVVLVNKSSITSIPYWKVVSTGQKLSGDSAKVNFVFAGTYSVTLLVAGNGGLDSVTKTVTIAQNDPNACNGTAIGFLTGCGTKVLKS